ncbi:hypothetical protein [Marinobacter changyiensis]|uniref:hypothetical protein n=1 Tax=Marinobacter changyiensis TaxID=2604091 RepID=UPI0012650816|nr:hypothetical protein [Marinobacter changyiensis]
MPTTRKRRSRGTANHYPAELHHVFSIGCGMNSYDQDWLEGQWRQYGRSFMDKNPNSNCFALTVYGPPESIEARPIEKKEI